MKFTFAKPALEKLAAAPGAVVVTAVAGEGEAGLAPAGAALDKAMKGALARAMAAKRFKGAGGSSVEVLAPAGLNASRLLVIGLGAADEIDAGDLEQAGGVMANALDASGETQAVLVIEDHKGAGLGVEEMAARAAYGARLKSYRFETYLTQVKDDDKASLAKVSVQVEGAAKARRRFAQLDAVADGVALTRDLVNEPANILYPEEFANRIKALTKLGLEVKVLGEKQMAKLGMGSLLGVGQGSVRESQLAIMRWMGAKSAKAKPVCFVGKGVCFDTGGVSLKPGPGMEEMTMDMGGAGVVTGLMAALAGRKAKVNAVGIVGLVENMPDGNAQRPGDIVTSMSGQTIEILNTDAEGRLVLADALWYAKETYDPAFIVDLATLTGAIIIALGHEHAGLFSNNDELSERIAQAGCAEGEKVWRLPMGEAYDKKLKSRLADMQNIGGRDAGSITAAQFLKRFVDERPWAHLDIAGVTLSKEARATAPKGATGFGVRLLDRLVADHYEE